MARKFRAVFFDVGGVLIPQPQIGIAAYAKEKRIPLKVLTNVFTKNEPNNAFCKLEIGKLTISEFFPLFEKEFHDIAKEANVECKSFSALELFENMNTKQHGIIPEMLNAVSILHQNGFKVGIITNNWIEDRDHLKHLKQIFFTRMRMFFDSVLESCELGIRKPDPKIYKMACDTLRVTPDETIFLDDIGRNLKGAHSIGITGIKVENVNDAINRLEKLTQIKIELGGKLEKDIFPAPCTPDEITHCYCEVQPNVVLHYVDIGEGPVVMLFHGFPELWYSWRYQITALCNAGFRVIAMDQRGFGNSSAPHEINAYRQEDMCRDAIGLMNQLKIPMCHIIGHDWGGSIVWNLALKFPDRIKSVCSINTPYFCHEGLQLLIEKIQVFNYQVYFQKPGVAEKELEADLERTFNAFFKETDGSKGFRPAKNLENAVENNGLLPIKAVKAKLLSKLDLDYFVDCYKKSGFRGGLNYYRNNKANKKWKDETPDRKITCPALMITTSHDAVLRAEFTKGMEKEIPNLSRAHIEGCGHWAMLEKPNDISGNILKWLTKVEEKHAAYKAKL